MFTRLQGGEEGRKEVEKQAGDGITVTSGIDNFKSMKQHHFGGPIPMPR